MNKTINKQLIPVLSGLLVLQLLVALGLNAGGNDYNPAGDDKPLVTVDPGAVDKISIEAGKEKVELDRLDDHWQVAGLDFPADSKNVDKLLNSLSNLDKGWPVATTDEAAERFKVTKDKFERKIVLSKGDKSLAELYIGTSPGLRKVHARLAGDKNIHSVVFNTFDASIKTDEWIDKAILKRDVADVSRAQLPGITLVRKDDKIVVDGLNDTQETKPEEAESLLKKVAGLKILSLFDKDAKDVQALDNPEKKTIKLTLKDGKEVSYVFAEPKDKHYYVLKSSDQPFYFKVATYTLNPILQTERETLVQAKQPENPKDDKTAVASAPQSDSKS